MVVVPPPPTSGRGGGRWAAYRRWLCKASGQACFSLASPVAGKPVSRTSRTVSWTNSRFLIAGALGTKRHTLVAEDLAEDIEPITLLDRSGITPVIGNEAGIGRRRGSRYPGYSGVPGAAS